MILIILNFTFIFILFLYLAFTNIYNTVKWRFILYFGWNLSWYFYYVRLKTWWDYFKVNLKQNNSSRLKNLVVLIFIIIQEQVNYWNLGNLKKVSRSACGNRTIQMEIKCTVSIQNRELELCVKMEPKQRLLGEVQVRTMEVWLNGYMKIEWNELEAQGSTWTYQLGLNSWSKKQKQS